MKQPIYLSIDLDFWQLNNFPYSFMEKILSMDVPIHAVDEHHHLLHHIHRFKCPIIINIDYHADICDNDKDYATPILNCGTWANHVKYRNKQKYIWIYRRKDCVRGRCNRDSGGYCNQYPKRNPFFVPKPEPICGWKKVSKRKSLPTANELSRVKAIGLAMSWEWASVKHEYPIRKLLKKYHVRLYEKPRKRVEID